MSQEKTRQFIKSGLFAVSVIGNIGFAAATLYQNQELLRLEIGNLELQGRLIEEQTAPRIQQRHIVLTGEAFRRLSEIDWNAAIMTGDTIGTFVTTPEAEMFLEIVKSNDLIAVKQIQGTFLQVINDGILTAENVEIIDSNGRNVNIGSLPTTITKFILIDFVTKNPMREVKALNPLELRFEYRINGDSHEGSADYVKLSPVSWTPSLDPNRGIGSAVFEERNLHMLED